MNTRRILLIMAIAIFGIVSIAPHSWAGSASHHRLEGAVIGIGAVLLGKAILDHHRYHSPAGEPVAVQRPYPRRYHRPAGYWETHKQWIPPKYEKVWNPGHHNHSGHWIPGHWTRIQTEAGYWHYERVWVPYH